MRTGALRSLDAVALSRLVEPIDVAVDAVNSSSRSAQRHDGDDDRDVDDIDSMRDDDNNTNNNDDDETATTSTTDDRSSMASAAIDAGDAADAVRIADGLESLRLIALRWNTKVVHVIDLLCDMSLIVPT
jgi:hypothetical protein